MNRRTAIKLASLSILGTLFPKLINAEEVKKLSHIPIKEVLVPDRDDLYMDVPYGRSGQYGHLSLLSNRDLEKDILSVHKSCLKCEILNPKITVFITKDRKKFIVCGYKRFMNIVS